VAFGYKPFSFGKALPRALSVHMRNIGENLLSRFRRVRHNTALGPPIGTICS
jgi:Flp pilus assembly protein TadB